MLNTEKFRKIKEEAEILYKSLGSVYCPYLSEEVIFISKNFEHLLFKNKHTARTSKEQYMRCILFKYAPLIIGKSNLVQGIRKAKEIIEEGESSSKILMSVNFYEFIAVIDNKRIRVVIKRVGNRSGEFLSIIPYWSKDRYNNRRLFFESEPDI